MYICDTLNYFLKAQYFFLFVFINKKRIHIIISSSLTKVVGQIQRAKELLYFIVLAQHFYENMLEKNFFIR